jgi:hypothetical protein
VTVGTPDLGCAAPPDTFTTAGLAGPANANAWDAWAWSSFAAFNWPALASTDTASYPSGFVRGVPDTTKSFASAQSTDVAVWETFKEKRELFNSTATPGAWQSPTFDPQYAPNFNGGQIQMCEGTYIFATWEHESIAQGAGYSYVNYSADSSNEQTDPSPYPNTAAGVQVARLKPYPLPGTAAIDASVRSQLPNSVWQHYRLIGTQFQAIPPKAPPQPVAAKK